ncbi:unnamed protein product [Rotaria sordida]|uniref:Uncharacterized protein n=1 Tax=Rotaria sordida TaxID=392033 RepID=A0A819CG53_9BILA|nr:unnamed protein product [Rotaria sordida]
MFHTTVILILCFTFLQTISSQNLNGIFLIDSCECNSSTETCEPNGPFILNQKRSTLIVKYGLWNGKTHLAELKCQHQGGIICTTKLRCLSGSCLDDTSIVISSASIKTTISFLFMIGILIMLV